MRWQGGYAGDMIMYMMHLSGYDIINVKFLDQIYQTGRVAVDFSHTSGALSEVDRMALDQSYRDSIDHEKLTQEILALNDSWIKSHYYNKDFDHMTTDIVVDSLSLPFVMAANVCKTQTLNTQRFHPVARYINDADLRFKLALHSVGYNSINTTTSSISQIAVSDIISGWDKIQNQLTDIGLRIDNRCQQFYEKWAKDNQTYFPSTQYVDMIKQKNYNWNCVDLPIHERYALLILSQEKFKILNDEK